MKCNSTSLLPLLTVLTACTRPAAIADLGPEPSLAPRVTSFYENHRDGVVQVQVGTARATNVTLLAVAWDSVTILLPGTKTASVWLEAGTHRVRVRPFGRPPKLNYAAPELPSWALGGAFPFSPRSSGSIPDEPCEGGRSCPLFATEAIMPMPPPPLPRYLLVIATERPLTLAEVQDRLRDADLFAAGRELLTEVAVRVAGSDARWAASALRR